jgi:hypothetical protein
LNAGWELIQIKGCGSVAIAIDGADLDRQIARASVIARGEHAWRMIGGAVAFSSGLSIPPQPK